MNALPIAALAFAMSTDAFAAAIGKGAALRRPDWREALRTGAIFGTIEALTPLVGWLLGSAAVGYLGAWDHWIAFTLLAALGAHMIWAGLRPGDEAAGRGPERHSFWNLAATGLATSIDAIAVGVGLAFAAVDIAWVAAAIGCATFVMVTSGIMLGRVLGAVVGKRAEVAGGILLVAIGAAILYEHVGVAA